MLKFLFEYFLPFLVCQTPGISFLYEPGLCIANDMENLGLLAQPKADRRTSIVSQEKFPVCDYLILNERFT